MGCPNGEEVVYAKEVRRPRGSRRFMSPPWRVTPARFGMLGYEGSVFVVT